MTNATHNSYLLSRLERGLLLLFLLFLLHLSASFDCFCIAVVVIVNFIVVIIAWFDTRVWLWMLCCVVVSDGDGLISAEDLFLAEVRQSGRQDVCLRSNSCCVDQARIMQRSPQFLRAIFRVYTESVWYPGRQLNHMSMARGQTANKPGTRTSG